MGFKKGSHMIKQELSWNLLDSLSHDAFVNKKASNSTLERSFEAMFCSIHYFHKLFVQIRKQISHSIRTLSFSLLYFIHKDGKKDIWDGQGNEFFTVNMKVDAEAYPPKNKTGLNQYLDVKPSERME